VLNAIWTAALLAVPGALVFGVSCFPQVLRWLCAAMERLHPPAARPQGPPVERLAADLRRISANLDALMVAGPIPGRILRVRSTTAAYDETLLLACRTLDVEPAGTSVPLCSEHRLRTEAALAGAGLRW